MSKTTIKIYSDLMGENQLWAGKIRELLQKKGITMWNFIGSPGSGKTTLLETMSTTLADPVRFAVLEGDIATTKDAERMAKKNIPVFQLHTSGACHLEAKLVYHALNDLPLESLDMIIVENVGNLVCPAEFDIGENGKIAILSVTEGEEKPLKYPLLFTEAQAVVLTKIDLLPHIPFQMKLCLDSIQKLNGRIPIFQLSAYKGVGIEEWNTWLQENKHK